MKATNSEIFCWVVGGKYHGLFGLIVSVEPVSCGSRFFCFLCIEITSFSVLCILLRNY